MTNPTDFVWQPLPGPQTDAYYSQADITGYGGSGGGGKSDWLIGISLTKHRKAIIFRREFPQLRDIIGRSQDVLAEVPGAKLNRNDWVYRLPGGRSLEFGAVQYEDDKRKYRGRPHDLIGFDEATEFTESQVQFLMGWLRTTVPGQRCRVCLTFNPPSSEEGMWVVNWFGPWVDLSHPNPAQPGELRWYAVVAGEQIERPDGEPFEHTLEDGTTEIVKPMSRTFFPARLRDNPYLSNTSYGTVLQSLPEPLRSQLLNGDFSAAMQPDRWQIVPLTWIQAANRRWEAYQGQPPCIQTCLGVDVAHGGDDRTVIAPRYGDFIGSLVAIHGRLTPDGRTAAAEVVKVWTHASYANVDAIGYGASCAERLYDKPPMGYGKPAVPVNVGMKSDFRDRSGRFGMANLKAEMFWRLREALDPDYGATLALPPDRELTQELTAHRYSVGPSGIKIEEKEKVKERIKRSPDKADAVALTMLEAKRPQRAAAASTTYRTLPGAGL